MLKDRLILLRTLEKKPGLEGKKFKLRGRGVAPLGDGVLTPIFVVL